MDSTHTDLLAVVVLLCVCVDRLGLTLSIACLPRAAGDPTLLPHVSASFDGEAWAARGGDWDGSSEREVGRTMRFGSLRGRILALSDNLNVLKTLLLVTCPMAFIDAGELSS